MVRHRRVCDLCCSMHTLLLVFTPMVSTPMSTCPRRPHVFRSHRSQDHFVPELDAALDAEMNTPRARLQGPLSASVPPAPSPQPTPTADMDELKKKVWARSVARFHTTLSHHARFCSCGGHLLCDRLALLATCCNLLPYRGCRSRA
jgi:hypothetical protein